MIGAMTHSEHGTGQTPDPLDGLGASGEGDLPTLELVVPMPGFPAHRRFVLVRLDADGVLCALRSVTDPELRFLVVPAAHFFPDYAPEIGEADAALLGLDADTPTLLLLVLSPGESLATTTANLLAPLVVNTGTRRAAQLVLADADLPVRAPLLG